MQGHSAAAPQEEAQAQPAADRDRQRHRLLVAGVALVAATLITCVVVLNESYVGGLPSRWRIASQPPREKPAPLPKLPWAPLLSEEEQQRGIAHYGDGARLRRLAAKLAAGRAVKAFTLGGSVTFGHGVADPSLSFPARFFRAINASFPHRDHVLSNQGLPGSTAPVVTPCVQAMIAPDPDLVVVEFSTNESPGAFTSRGRQSFEALLRALLALPSAPAVVLLHHYPWWKSPGDGATEGLFYREPEGQLSMFAHYYGIPSLSLRSAAWRLMQAGVPGFKASLATPVDRVVGQGNRNMATGRDIPAAEPGSEHLYFYHDTIHPGPSGHQVLAELLVGLLQRAVREAASGAAPAARQDPRLPPLPPPMIPNFEDSRASLCAQLRDFEAVVKAQQGFVYRPEKPALPSWVEQKWGWGAEDPGAWAELDVDTRAPPGLQPRRTEVLLSHLRSSAGMGTAEVRCAAGCACAPSVLDGTTAARVSVFKVHAFQATRHAACRLRVTVRREAGAVAQEGHKVLLAAVMVTHQV